MQTMSTCPACGDSHDAKHGSLIHSANRDPYGWGVLAAHDAGFHADCDPRGCSEYRHAIPHRARVLLSVGEV